MTLWSSIGKLKTQVTSGRPPNLEIFPKLQVDTPHKEPVMQSFDSIFVVSPIKPLNKESSGQWNQPPCVMGNSNVSPGASFTNMDQL